MKIPKQNQNDLDGLLMIDCLLSVGEATVFDREMNRFRLFLVKNESNDHALAVLNNVCIPKGKKRRCIDWRNTRFLDQHPADQLPPHPH